MGDLDWRAVRELLALGTRLREAAERALLPSYPLAAGAPAAFDPPVDVWESDDEYIVEVELPGAVAGDIDAHLEGGALVLTGALREGGAPGGRYLRIERPRGRFRRVVALPAGVAGEPRAVLRDGVLQVRLPKALGRRRVAVLREAE